MNQTAIEMMAIINEQSEARRRAEAKVRNARILVRAAKTVMGDMEYWRPQGDYGAPGPIDYEAAWDFAFTYLGDPLIAAIRADAQR